MKPQVFKADKLFDCPTEFKALPDKDGQRRVEGYASIFGNVDSYGDVVVKGAFKKTIKERVPKGLVPFVADHGYEAHKLLGIIDKASEDDNGLYYEAGISKAPSADDYYIKMAEGILHQSSFGFRTIGQKEPKGDAELIDGKVVYRYLTEVMLLDIAPVVMAANERARITQVKAFNDLLNLIDNTELKSEDLRIAAARLLKMAEDVENEIKSDSTAEPVDPLTVESLEIEAQSIAIEIETFSKQLEI